MPAQLLLLHQLLLLRLLLLRLLLPLLLLRSLLLLLEQPCHAARAALQVLLHLPLPQQVCARLPERAAVPRRVQASLPLLPRVSPRRSAV